ncbi:hypothetical protein CHY23_02290 (plasmid) [Actinobacillus pleuropneumoniae]|nr:hypothetical protein CHY23_02290 [Actinobacillus pleuropneumoniae]
MDARQALNALRLKGAMVNAGLVPGLFKGAVGVVAPCLAGLLKPCLGLQALGLLRPAPLWLFAVVPLKPLVSRALDTVVLPLGDHQVAMGVLTVTGMDGQRIRQALALSQMPGEFVHQLPLLI